MAMLAASDTVAIWIAAASMVVSVGLSIFTWWRDRQYGERMRKFGRIEDLEKRVNDQAERLIDQKLEGLFNHLKGVIDVIDERVQTVKDRLSRGDQTFDDLDKRDRELEQRFNVRFDQMKEYMHKQFATKSDVRGAHHRMDKIEQQLGQQRSAQGAGQ